MGSNAIALGIQPPPPVAGPLDLYKEGQSVQSLINQQALQKQQQQSNAISMQQQQIQLQQQQQAQKDAEIFNKSFHDSNGDWNSAIADATKNGASGQFITQAQMHRADQVTKFATADKDTLANEQTRLDSHAKDALKLLDTPPEDRPQAWAQLRNGHLATGAYKASDISEQVPTEDQLKSTVAQSKAAQDMLKEAAEIQAKNAELPGVKADAVQKQFVNASTIMNGAQEQNGWTARRNMAVANNPALDPLIPKEYSPANAEQVRLLGIPPDKRNVTETELAVRSAAGDPQAEAALKRLDASKRASRPVTQNLVSNSDVKDIADAIENGDQPPTLQGLYKNGAPVRAELARRGVPIAQMETDWKATQRYLSTLNGPQQTRLRQDIATVSDSLDKVEDLYNQWKQLAPQSGFKVLNKATLKAMENLPGKPGAIATALEAQIADTTAGLGTIYMGGNSPTDHSLGLAAHSLSADWNDDTFTEALKQAHANVKIRNNSITHAQPAGVSANNTYAPQQPAAATFTAPAGAPAPPKEDGHKLKANGQVVAVSKGGQWVAP